MNGKYEAFLPEVDAESPAPTLHPQSESFYAPNAFVVHRGKQQHVG